MPSRRTIKRRAKVMRGGESAKAVTLTPAEFDSLDTDNNGVLSLAELSKGMSEVETNSGDNGNGNTSVDPLDGQSGGKRRVRRRSRRRGGSSRSWRARRLLTPPSRPRRTSSPNPGSKNLKNILKTRFWMDQQ